MEITELGLAGRGLAGPGKARLGRARRGIFSFVGGIVASDIYKITVLKWEKNNAKIKKGHTHFLLSKRFFDDPKISTLPLSGQVLFLRLLCSCADHASNYIECSHDQCVTFAGGRGVLVSTLLNHMQSLQLLTYEKITPFINRIEKKRKEKNIMSHSQEAKCSTEFDLEFLYKKYPLKKGKSSGLKIAKAQIKTQADFDNLSQAIDAYVSDITKNQTSAKYIKHFSTFMSSWRDWLDPETGTAILEQQKSESQKWLEEQMRKDAENGTNE